MNTSYPILHTDILLVARNVIHNDKNLELSYISTHNPSPYSPYKKTYYEKQPTIEHKSMFNQTNSEEKEIS